MQILVRKDNNICEKHGIITLGRFPEANPDIDLYKIELDNVTDYAIAEYYNLFEVSSLPEDYNDGGRYLYINNQFILNEEFIRFGKLMVIKNLKEYMTSTDYIYARCAETGEDIQELYADVITQRKATRIRIQELEKELEPEK